MRLPDLGTTRRTITDYFIQHRHLLEPEVLEVGSSRPPDAWWADIRAHVGMTDEAWFGVDLEPSDFTHMHIDICGGALPAELVERFGSCVCAETLEHVSRPHAALRFICNALKPGGHIVITCPFAFPVHNFPSDYWRFTPEGMKLLLRDAGFVEPEAKELNVEEHAYWDHIREPFSPEGMQYRSMGMWIGAFGRKPA